MLHCWMEREAFIEQKHMSNRADLVCNVYDYKTTNIRLCDNISNTHYYDAIYSLYLNFDLYVIMGIIGFICEG